MERFGCNSPGFWKGAYHQASQQRLDDVLQSISPLGPRSSLDPGLSVAADRRRSFSEKVRSPVKNLHPKNIQRSFSDLAKVLGPQRRPQSHIDDDDDIFLEGAEEVMEDLSVSFEKFRPQSLAEVNKMSQSPKWPSTRSRSSTSSSSLCSPKMDATDNINFETFNAKSHKANLNTKPKRTFSLQSVFSPTKRKPKTPTPVNV